MKEITEMEKTTVSSSPAGTAATAHAQNAGPIELRNAGLVLMAPYLQRLFSMFGLTAGSAFVDQAAAERAAHLIQYIVSGASTTPEHLLSLNKLLCGLAVDAPIIGSIELTENECKTIDSLLDAVISHWRALGSTSHRGLREAFLVRDGHLEPNQQGWQLRVRPAPFDMLLERLPWDFSTVRYPWMQASLFVRWR